MGYVLDSAAMNEFTKIGYGLGTLYYGSGFRVSRNEMMKLAGCALDAGVNWLDCGEEYGAGHAERLVGELRSSGFEFKISHKFSVQHTTKKALIEACKKSVGQMGDRAIDLYQFHWPCKTFDVLQDLVDGLLELRLSGFIKAFGAGNFSTSELKTLENINGFTSHQLKYSVNQRQFETFCDEFKHCNHIAYGVLKPLSLPVRDQQNMQKLLELSDMCDVSVASLLLAWATRFSNSFALFGSVNRKRVAESSEVIGTDVPRAILEEMSALYPVSPVTMCCSDLMVSENILGGGYRSITEALDSELGVEIKELAESFLDRNSVNPVVVRQIGSKWLVIEGGIRYWAHRLAFGNDSLINTVHGGL